jgi:hypothetical protein
MKKCGEGCTLDSNCSVPGTVCSEERQTIRLDYPYIAEAFEHQFERDHEGYNAIDQDQEPQQPIHERIGRRDASLSQSSSEPGVVAGKR